ncbi:hypothetical protein ACFQ1S_14600 [Kibdelosporangium lantanae]|uniref:Uncharacterized protein n=1 Tax=Kibdelosporangium lantanae TaxID=1497396 RepID=A0ABW3MAS8_9PSEU
MTIDSTASLNASARTVSDSVLYSGSVMTSGPDRLLWTRYQRVRGRQGDTRFRDETEVDDLAAGAGVGVLSARKVLDIIESRVSSS